MARSLSASLVDRARHDLCRRICECFRDGAVSVRIRRDLNPPAVWIYEKQDRTWKKRGEGIDDPRLIEAIDQELENFSSRQHSSVLNSRKTSKPDWKAVDMTFYADAIRDHLDQLESYVYGVLYYNHADHNHDARRRMRRGSNQNGRRN